MNLHLIQNKIALLALIASFSCLSFGEDYETVRKLAEQGNAAAQFDLGTMYDAGEGVERNFTEAAKWYLKAAEQGDSAAQYNLAIMYDSGEGVEKDIVKAYSWITAAEVFGNKGARESSKDFLIRMTPEQIEKGDKAVITIVNQITESKNNAD